MVILLQINKITFGKSENLGKKIHISQNLAKFLTKVCCFFKKVFFMVYFLNFSGGKSI